MWEKLDTIGTEGSEGGIILRDEEYKRSCRITLEECEDCCTITCGVYGAMVHTSFCDKGDETRYEAMKQELQAFLETDLTTEEQYEFYKAFVLKY